MGTLFTPIMNAACIIGTRILGVFIIGVPIMGALNLGVPIMGMFLYVWILPSDGVFKFPHSRTAQDVSIVESTLQAALYL